MRRKLITLIALLATMPAVLFSQSEAVRRMTESVKILTADSLGGRATGTIYEQKTAAYIQKEFEKRGITLLYPSPGQDFSLIVGSGDTIKSQNVVAIVEGWDKVLKDEYIVVGAHYDHLGKSSITVNGRDSTIIYRGADDNASGIAVMLEVASMIRESAFQLKRSVMFVAFGAEERGMVGSWYFANRAFAHINKISLMVNLDMVGRGLNRDKVSAYTVVPHTQLITMLRDVSDLPLMITPQIHATDYFPSDHQVFASKGIPTVLLTTQIHRDYHTPKDTPDKLNFSLMEEIANYVYNLVKSSANTESMLERTVFANDSVKTLDSKRVYNRNQVDKVASFMKGDETKFLNSWIYRYLKYPTSAIDKGIQGRVIVSFIVERDGEVSNVEIEKSIDEELDAQVVKVVKASPKWKPAVLKGEPVRSKISLPVEFRLRR